MKKKTYLSSLFSFYTLAIVSSMVIPLNQPYLLVLKVEVEFPPDGSDKPDTKVHITISSFISSALYMFLLLN